MLCVTGSAVGMPLTMMSSREEEALRFFQYVEDSGLRAYSGVVTRDLVWNEKTRSVPEKNDKKRKQEEVVKRLVEHPSVKVREISGAEPNRKRFHDFSWSV